jgi:hypothetical protein
VPPWAAGLYLEDLFNKTRHPVLRCTPEFARNRLRYAAGGPGDPAVSVMSSLESRIDDLYQRPLVEFIPARAALASELKGDDARRVKQLKKPTSAPWAVNQVYWHARPVFDRVLKSGSALRRAQLGALEGRTADVRGATGAHRQAVSDAVAKAIELAGESSVQPDRDALSRTFEALSLASTPPESPGRLTQPLQPGGFEMLTGVEPAAQAAPRVGLKLAPRARPSGSGRAVEEPDTSKARLKPDATEDEKVRTKADVHHVGGVRLPPSLKLRRTAVALAEAGQADPARARAEARRAAAAARAYEREQAAAARRRDAAIKKAEATLARAREKEGEAERAWRQAQEDVDHAKRALRSLQS